MLVGRSNLDRERKWAYKHANIALLSKARRIALDILVQKNATDSKDVDRRAQAPRFALQCGRNPHAVG